MLSAEDVRILDVNSAWHGVPPSLLMQNAGHAVADVALKRFAPRRVLVLCGLGNNGGDGAVAAKKLAAAGVAVTVLYAGDPATIRSGEAGGAFRGLDGRTTRIEAFRSRERALELCRDADLLIDGLLGVGARGELRPPMDAVAKAARASRRPILAIDVPSGLGARSALRATLTVTLHARKKGMDPSTCGNILVRDIGIPNAAEDEIGPGHLAVPFPRSASQSHKGQNGRLLVVAGGPYTGAPILSSMAALRVGCDLVHLVAPEDAAEAARAHSPDLIVHEGSHDDRFVADDLRLIEPWIPKVDAVLIGPGLGTHKETAAAVRSLLERTQRARLPVILDADAFPVAGQHHRLLAGRPALATPHAREFLDLTGRKVPSGVDAAAHAVAREAKRLRSTILLKGPVDIVSDGPRTLPNRIHHPWMTVGGTGDVLAGIAAGLVAKGLNPFRGACAAVVLNGLAGQRAFGRKSWACRASDLLDEIPHVLAEWVTD